MTNISVKPINYLTIDSGLKNLVIDSDTNNYYLLEGNKLDIILKENAQLELVIFNETNLDNELNIRLEKNANLRIYNIVLTNDSVLLKENIYLEKEHSKCEIISVLLAKEKAYLDSDINIYHNVGNTSSIFENYGIAKESAKMILNNNATIKQGARKSVVQQKAKGLTLSKHAVIKAMPNLYIDEYDVIANHSASIGSISKDDLFYLMSRGLSVHEASNLVIMGFINPIIDHISDEELKNRIKNSFIKKLTK